MSSSAAVGAEDFLARFAPNLSLKERSGLTSMVREAVRDYMEDNRLTQPPPPRMLAHMMQEQKQQQQQRSRELRPASVAPGGFTAADVNEDYLRDWGRPPPTPLGLPRRRPQTSRGGGIGGEEEFREGEDFCVVGNSTGIATESPRYAMVSPKFAPQPTIRRTFPDTLMGFASETEAKQEISGTRGEEKPQREKETTAATDPTARPAAAPAAKRPVTANWLSWRATTPFCVSDRELRAFRHRQNPRKPMPDDLPHVAMYRRSGRPGTARGSLDRRGDAASHADRGILDWVQGASEQEKQVAYNLLKAINSGRTQGLETYQQVRPENHTFGRRTRPQTPRVTLMRPEPEPGTKHQKHPAELFHGVGDNFVTARSRVNPLRPTVDYVHSGAGFTNAAPPYRSNFTVHPDWVSEAANPPAPLIRRRPNLAAPTK